MVRLLVLLIAALSMLLMPLSAASARAHKGEPAAHADSHAKKKKGAKAPEPRERAQPRGRGGRQRDDDREAAPRGGSRAHGKGKKDPADRGSRARSRDDRYDDRDDGPPARKGKKGRAAAQSRAEREDDRCEPVRASRGRHSAHRKPAHGCAPHGRADRDESYDDTPRHGGKAGRDKARVDEALDREIEESCDTARKPTRGRRGARARKPVVHCESAPKPRVRDHGRDRGGDSGPTRLAPPPWEPGHGTTPSATPPPPAVISKPDSPAEAVKSASPAPGIIVESNPGLWAERRQAQQRPRTAGRLSAATLMGRNERELRAALGEPDLQRSEGDGALWTYRLPQCALLVFMHRAGGQEFKVSGTQSSPLQRGGAVPDVDACLKAAASR
jgi:hypothetical protein